MLDDFLTGLGPEILLNLGTTLGLLVTGVIVQRIAKSILQRVLTKTNLAHITTKKAKKEIEVRMKTLNGLLRNVISTVTWGVVFVMILSTWGVNIAPILTGAGILGLAVGFGSQTLVKDIVTGFFILFENQFNTGDEIEVLGVRGVVQSINLRTTILKQEDGTTNIFPNNQVTKIAKNFPAKEEEKKDEESKEKKKEVKPKKKTTRKTTKKEK